MLLKIISFKILAYNFLYFIYFLSLKYLFNFLITLFKCVILHFVFPLTINFTKNL